MNRQEHLDWCKQRANECLDRGNVADALASMLSDLGKHDETRGVGEMMAPIGLVEAMNNNVEGMRRFVDGFN